MTGLLTSKIIRNFVSVSSIHLANKALSITITVYLARVLSAEGFGSIEFARALLVYFAAFTNLGLETFGLREAAKHKKKIPSYVDTILSIRALTVIFSYIGYALVVLLKGFPYDFSIAVLIMGLILFGQAASVNFVFLALEKAGVIARRTITVNIATVGFTFLFVKSASDIWVAALIIIISSVVTAFWIILKYSSDYRIPRFSFDFEAWHNILKESLPMALSFFIVGIHTTVDVIMLGLIKSQYDVGIYSAAYKVVMFLLLPLQVIVQTFFPRLAASKINGNQKMESIRFAIVLVLAGLVSGVSCFVLADQIILWLFGIKYSPSIIILKILSASVLISYINSIFADFLVAWNKQNLYLIVVTVSVIVNIILNLLIIPEFGGVGAASVTVLGKFVMLSLLAFFTYRYRETIFSFPSVVKYQTHDRIV